MDLILRHFVFICGYTFDMSKTPTSVGNIMWICRYQLHIGSEDIIIYAEGVRPYSLMVGHFTFYEEIGVQFPVGLELYIST